METNVNTNKDKFAHLIQGSTETSMRRNIQILIARGYSEEQATAIAKEVRRRNEALQS